MLQNILTSALPEGGRYVSISEVSLYALIGFLVVFSGITFLILIVWLVGKMMSKSSKTIKQERTKEPKKQEVPATVNVVESEEISEETIAVIMAALTAYYQKNNPKCEFTLKRIKRM